MGEATVLKERKVIDRCEILRSGHIQVREALEIYDDANPGVVKSKTYHRYVVDSNADCSKDVQDFMDNRKLRHRDPVLEDEQATE